MQTFLPYPNIYDSAMVLDMQRPCGVFNRIEELK